MTTNLLARNRIVVGVDASQASRHAVLWAAEEAYLRHSTLIVTNVGPVTVGSADTMALSSLTSTGELLDSAAASASSRQPGVAVGTMVLRGSISDDLVALSRISSLLVLGSQRVQSRPMVGVLGLLQDRVVAQSECPVVVVSGSSAPVSGPDGGRVVVGWTHHQQGLRTLEVGAAEAELRAAPLGIVVFDAGDAPVANVTSPLGWLEEAVVSIRLDHPGLTVTVEGRTPATLSDLPAVAGDADLLVVGCEHSADPGSIRVGSLAGLALGEVECPVMLVGQSAGSRSPGAALPRNVTAA